MIFSGKVFMPDTQPIMPEMTFRLGQAGMTLLELMISLSLGLLLVAGIGTIYVGSNQTYRVQEKCTHPGVRPVCFGSHRAQFEAGRLLEHAN